MAAAGWMVITGAGGGIMEAGHEGPGREKSFGVAIRLPFEGDQPGDRRGQQTDPLPVLLHAQAHVPCRSPRRSPSSRAVSGRWTSFEGAHAHPDGQEFDDPDCAGGGRGGNFGSSSTAMRQMLLSRGWISPRTRASTSCAATPARRATTSCTSRIYHSSRYVKDDLVIG